MTRALLLIIAVLVFLWLLRRALAARKNARSATPPKPTLAPDLVACARCGVHLPRSEALAADEDEGSAAAGRFFCSQEHLRLGPD